MLLDVTRLDGERQLTVGNALRLGFRLLGGQSDGATLSQMIAAHP